MNNPCTQKFKHGQKSMKIALTLCIVWLTTLHIPRECHCQQIDVAPDDGAAHFSFDGNTENSNRSIDADEKGDIAFVSGVKGMAVRFDDHQQTSTLSIDQAQLNFDSQHDFAVEFWVRTTMSSDDRAILLSTKDVADNGLSSQKEQGWTFSFSNGTWGWNAGSGNRRISYERTNGEHFKINDGRWHQLAMSHDAANGLIRLFFDGENWVTYNVKDSNAFEFGTDSPLTVGWHGKPESRPASELPVFVKGANQLQALVDEFNRIGLPPVTSSEFEMMISQPSRLVSAKIDQLSQTGEENGAIIDRAKSFDLKKIEALSKRLMRSPYTVHQSSYYNEVALLFKLYKLNNGIVTIDDAMAKQLARREVLRRPAFDMDELKLWNRHITPEEISTSYSRFFQSKNKIQPNSQSSFVAGTWNIFHGGLHQSFEVDGFDSRSAIVDLLKRENVDVLMLQETYSSGDHIAAELGYYFATTIDWDNMNQGSNISVVSRFPIRDVFVPPQSTFMSVGTKISLSQTQQIYVVSNWFGMRNFDDVFDFHQERFEEFKSIPTLFAGDFNAVPHTDGGKSPASEKLLKHGFIDAFRRHFPNVENDPGFTHRSNRRIDQLYYKGKGLHSISTQVLSTWPSIFPSDHYLIKTNFRLDKMEEQDEHRVDGTMLPVSPQRQ